MKAAAVAWKHANLDIFITLQVEVRAQSQDTIRNLEVAKAETHRNFVLPITLPTLKIGTAVVYRQRLVMMDHTAIKTGKAAFKPARQTECSSAERQA